MSGVSGIGAVKRDVTVASEGEWLSSEIPETTADSVTGTGSVVSCDNFVSGIVSDSTCRVVSDDSLWVGDVAVVALVIGAVVVACVASEVSEVVSVVDSEVSVVVTVAVFSGVVSSEDDGGRTPVAI